jgi:hypothetical protein
MRQKLLQRLSVAAQAKRPQLNLWPRTIVRGPRRAEAQHAKSCCSGDVRRLEAELPRTKRVATNRGARGAGGGGAAAAKVLQPRSEGVGGGATAH